MIKTNVYFSPGEDCKNAIINFIKNAKKELKICVFTISDNDISGEIADAFRRGVEVKIITDDEKSFDKGSDVSFLSNIGVDVKIDRTKNHMHHKFATADNNGVLTGSFNWTRSASKFNHENIIISNEFRLIDSFKNEFNRLWPEMVDLL